MQMQIFIAQWVNFIYEFDIMYWLYETCHQVWRILIIQFNEEVERLQYFSIIFHLKCIQPDSRVKIHLMKEI